MDLVAGVRKEGSRGGRAEFKWEDVKDSSHRENYLGHSVMAPVGRWQKGRDLSWYAKSGDSAEAAEAAAAARREEIRKIKEAEQDALSEALGYGPVPKRRKEDEEAGNANLEPLGGVGRKDVERAVKEGGVGEDDGEEGRGVGFGGFSGGGAEDDREILLGDGSGERGVASNEVDMQKSRRRGEVGRDGRDDSRERRRRRRRHEERRRHHHHRRRSRDRSSDRERRRRDDDDRRDRHRERHRSRSPERRRYGSRSHEKTTSISGRRSGL